MEDRGVALWFTGMSGAGKSTLSARVAEELRNRSRLVEVLDGDEVRENLSRGLGFSREDRDTNIRRIGFVSRLLARNGVVAITAAISPYADTREEVRRAFDRERGTFVEIYCKCSLDTLIERDPKGLYRRALNGEIRHFTGIDDPYEPPERPEIAVDTENESVEVSVRRILRSLELMGLIPERERVSDEEDAAIRRRLQARGHAL